MKKKLINGIITMGLIVSLGVNVVQANNNQFQQKVINNLESDVYLLENPSDANCELLETMWKEEEKSDIGTAYMVAIGTPYMEAIGDAYSKENMT
jgi:peptidoglycan hydrolase CwlO-like protein